MCSKLYRLQTDNSEETTQQTAQAEDVDNGDETEDDK